MRRQNNKPTKTVQNKKNNKKKQIQETGTIIPLRPRDIMPPKITRVLNYIDSNHVRSNSGALYLVYSLRINDLYDPDPLILSGLVSGFKELMQFYTSYRVVHTKVHLTISNNEAFPLLYGIQFGTSSLVGVISNRDDAVNVLENDFTTRARMISAKGGIDTDEIQTSVKPGFVLGDNRQYQSELGYAGQGLATPPIPLYMNFIIASPGSTNLANGVTTALTLEFKANFFGRVNVRA